MILFIDTHAELITIALKNGADLFVKTQESEYSHSIYTMPMIESIFSENNLSVKDVKKIIVVNGPGSFTGIRIGVSIAKTMAYALNCDINTVSSLEAYLVSDETDDNKKSIIEDNKGYYIGTIENGVFKEYYNEEDNCVLRKVDEKLNIERIIKYCENKESENPHFVKANYVKKIEVEQ